MDCISTDFSVDSSSRFPSGSRTYTDLQRQTELITLPTQKILQDLGKTDLAGWKLYISDFGWQSRGLGHTRIKTRIQTTCQKRRKVRWQSLDNRKCTKANQKSDRQTDTRPSINAIDAANRTNVAMFGVSLLSAFGRLERLPWKDAEVDATVSRRICRRPHPRDR